MGNIELLCLIVFVWNVVVFLLYGIDKLKARLGRYRTSEKVLIVSSLLFGAFGGMLGMVVFNHKTSKAKFRYLVPVFWVVQFLCYAFIIHKEYIIYLFG